jgi:hypothetical protein
MLEHYDPKQPDARVAMSDELRAALKRWLDWVERGAPDGEPYSRWRGLCSSLRNNELDRVFNDCGFPFGVFSFIRDRDNATMHTCPKRLAFVRANV